MDIRIINHAPLSFVCHVVKEGILAEDKDIGKRTGFEDQLAKFIGWSGIS